MGTGAHLRLSRAEGDAERDASDNECEHGQRGRTKQETQGGEEHSRPADRDVEGGDLHERAPLALLGFRLRRSLFGRFPFATGPFQNFGLNFESSPRGPKGGSSW